jgi:hypothetical protein
LRNVLLKVALLEEWSKDHLIMSDERKSRDEWVRSCGVFLCGALMIFAFFIANPFWLAESSLFAY